MTLIFLLYILFATAFPISKLLLSYSAPIFLTGSRMAIAGIVLLAYQYFSPTAEFHIKRKHFWYFAQIIILGIIFTYILRFFALEHLPPGKASFFYNFSPFMSSLYAYVLFKERMSLKQWVGLFIGFIGMIPIVVSSTPEEAGYGEWFKISWFEFAIIISVALHSYSRIIIQRLVRDKSYSPVMVNGIAMGIGGLIALIISFFVEGPAPVTNVISFSGWLAVIIIVSNIFCHNLYGYLLKKYTATFLSFAGFMAPMFSAFYGWAFFNEKITWHYITSAIVVFIGLYLFYQDELRKRPQIEA